MNHSTPVSSVCPRPAPRPGQFSSAPRKGSLRPWQAAPWESSAVWEPLHTHAAKQPLPRPCLPLPVPRCHLHGHSVLSWVSLCRVGRGACMVQWLYKGNFLGAQPHGRNRERVSNYVRGEEMWPLAPPWHHIIMQYCNCLFICWSQLLGGKFLESEIVFY